MEQKINLVELLKDCPGGMELDCTLFEGLEFDGIVDNECLPIRCRIKQPNGGYNVFNFTKYGCWLDTTFAKCVIFPKGKTTWKGFQRPFKDGDVIFGCNSACSYIAIYKSNRNEMSFNYYACLTSLGRFNTDHFGDNLNLRLATEEEKQKLLDEIKTRRYKWNPETKTLKKLIKPRFKVGDEIVQRNSISNSWIVNSVSSEYYGLRLDSGFDGTGVLPISEQDDWELITNKLERSVEPKFKVGDTITNGDVIAVIKQITKDSYVLDIIDVDICFNYVFFKDQDKWKLISNKLEKLVEPKFKVGDVIQDEDAYKVTITEVNIEDECYEYESVIAKGIGGIAFSEQDNWKLVSNKFDINTLKPFESKVLVRQHQTSIWMPAIFGGYDIPNLSYYAVGGTWWKYCIPYKGNEHLRGTVGDCSNYYKTWE